MKKHLSFVLFGLITFSCIAQDRIVLLRDTTRLSISVADLEQKYPPALAKKASEQAAFKGQTKIFFDNLFADNKRFLRYVEKNKRRLPLQGLMLKTKEFVRPDGTYDRVLCEFSGREMTPEQEVNLLQFIAEWYGQNPFPLKSKTGFRWDGIQTVLGTHGTPTDKRFPGTVNTLEAAKQTNRPDTVKKVSFVLLELKSIPDVVYRFPNLEELDLSRNLLNELPARLTADIPTLKKLSLLYNSIPDDSVFFTRNKHLLALNLQGNKLTHIPESVRLNRRLESLWLGNNELKELNVKPLRRLRRLNDLNLYSAGLTQLPKTIGRLKHVKVLDLYYNKFAELPRQLGRMKRLEQLAVSHNDLKALPASLAKLRGLKVLFAHHNRISQLPTEFGRLQQLRVLNLGYNWFSVAPDVLGALPALEELDLNNNNLQEFPTVLLSMKNLKKLYMGSNPLFGREAMASPYAQQLKQLEANKIQVTY